MSPSTTHHKEKVYWGRFAPSPTGPLHFGSLVAATASYLDARSHEGLRIVRMEDLDSERVQVGADDAILADLEHFGFTWDGPVLWARPQRRKPRGSGRWRVGGCGPSAN
ncbi:MAG: hypothetical protein HY820_21620 [Acidobacteria bacterium]|nr:hypothetical protein [Acidobacteriota bacterium]